MKSYLEGSRSWISNIWSVDITNTGVFTFAAITQENFNVLSAVFWNMVDVSVGERKLKKKIFTYPEMNKR